MTEVNLMVINAHILTMDTAMREIKNGALAIHNGQFVAVGTLDEVSASYKGSEVIDAQHQLVLPGFVNTHTHAGMTIFRGYADDLELHSWLNDYIFPAEAKYVNAETVKVGTQLAILEMLQTGTTCFNDMYFFEHEVAQQAQQAGMRVTISEGILDFPTPNSKTPDQALSYQRELLQEYKNNDLVQVAVGAHSPYTCSSELLQQTKALANEHNAMLHIHLAETKWEFDTLLEKHKKTPTEYLNSLGLLDANTIAAHSIYLTDNDLELFAQQKTKVAHNPTCNMKLASGVARVPEMLAQGITVGLGTDGAASNNRLDLLREMQNAALVHKLNSNDTTAANARSMVRMLTIDGAKALSRDKEIGSIEVGKKADFVTISQNNAHQWPRYDIYSQLAYATNSSDIENVFINGKQVVKQGVVQTINAADCYANVQQIADTIQSQEAKK